MNLGQCFARIARFDNLGRRHFYFDEAAQPYAVNALFIANQEARHWRVLPCTTGRAPRGRLVNNTLCEFPGTILQPDQQQIAYSCGLRNQVCIVADRGMISAATIAALEKAGLAYILGVRERSTKEVRNEVIEDDGVAVPLVIPRQKGETQLAIKETTLKGRRYVLCRNEEEARKDADRRAAILAGLDRKLAHGDKALVSNKGFRRFVKTIGSGNFSIDYDKAEADAKFDGLFVLRTNTKLSALQVVLRYRNLLAVEDTFKTTKAPLTTRPIFHKTDAAIRGHIFCSFLAVLLRKELFDRLAARRHGDLEWQHIVDDLDELSEIEVEQDGRRALLRTAPGATIDPLCRALGITLPPVFQEIPPAPKPARSCGA